MPKPATMADYVEALVRQAPPITPEQVATLRALLGPYLPRTPRSRR